jgi:hypothetical protein
MIRITFLGLLIIGLALGSPLSATASGSPEPSAVWANALAKLDRHAAIDSESATLLMILLQKEFGTAEEELMWSLDRKMTGGDIAALAYIQATTGKSFAGMEQENARRDFWVYAEEAGMSRDKMAHWLNGFQKRLERERNSRIFDRLRASRRVHPLPDLGSGFGLFQEALDFRRLDSARPTKVHGVGGEFAKGEK